MKSYLNFTAAILSFLIIVFSCEPQEVGVVKYIFIGESSQKGEIVNQHGKEVERKETVFLKSEMLRAGVKLEAKIFDHQATFEVIEQKEENNGMVWTGKIDGEGESYFILTKYNGKVNVDFAYSKGRFQIKDLGNEAFELRKLDEIFLATLKEDGNAVVKEMKGGSAKSSCDKSDNDIDIAVYYTNEAKIAAGGTPYIEAEAYHAVSTTNVVFVNSSINAFLNLVLIKELGVIDTAADMLSVLEATNKPNTLSSSEFVNSVVAADKLTYHFDVGMLLISREIGNVVGMAWGRSAESSAANLDSYFNSYASVGVSSRIHATANFTFQHELGHIFSLDHDCGNTSMNTIQNYSHGYCSSSFRTVMGSSNCATTRIPYFSNPQISYGGTAVGTSGGTLCEADAAQALNGFLNRIANYACENNSFPDAIIKDSWLDDGSTPTLLAPSDVIYNSVDVWIRNSQDGSTNEHMHQDPEYGQDNYIYVKVRNGNVPITGTVEVYVADANTNLSWYPGGGPFFSLIGTSTISIPAHDTEVAEIVWPQNLIPNSNIPGVSPHQCLYVRWVSAADPMQSGEGFNIHLNTIYNNNITWKNLTIVNLVQLPPHDPTLGWILGEVKFLNTKATSVLSFSSTNRGRTEAYDFFKKNLLYVEFDKASAKLVQEKDGIKKVNETTFAVSSIEAGLTLSPTEKEVLGSMRLYIKNLRETDECILNITHSEGKEKTGGYSFEFVK